MNSNNIYIVNISSETLMCLILLFLLGTCVLQWKRKKTMKALIILIITDILLMICQIVEWYLMLIGGKQTIQGLPVYYNLKKTIYTLDYALFFYVSLAFYNYINCHINDICIEKKIDKKINNTWTKVIFIWGIVITTFFRIFMNADWFYFIDENNREMFHKEAYLIMYTLGVLGSLSSAVILVVNNKILGRLNFAILFAYIITPPAFVVLDLLSGTCITYILTAIYAFVLYIYMDLRRENELIQKEEKILIQDRELTELNTQIMLSQMQPHFLYNTLSTISGLCYMEGATRAKQVVDKFAVYFRENLDALGKEKFISFEKELSHIQTYLWLEQVRFEGALNVEYDIGVMDFSLPSLSIQPIVENAVKHGIRKKKGGGTVWIMTKDLPDEYQIIVKDDGAGFIVGAKPDDKRSHIGLENIRKRLEILSNGSYQIESEPGKGTTVIVHIPKGGLYENNRS